MSSTELLGLMIVILFVAFIAILIVLCVNIKEMQNDITFLNNKLYEVEEKKQNEYECLKRRIDIIELKKEIEKDEL